MAMISRSMPTRQAASCQQPGWPKTSKQQMWPRRIPRSPKDAASRLTASTSHFGAVMYSPIKSISDLFLIRRSVTQAVYSFDWSTMRQLALGRDEAEARRRARRSPASSSAITRHESVHDAAGFEKPRRRLAGDRRTRRFAVGPMGNHPANRIEAEAIEELLSRDSAHPAVQERRHQVMRRGRQAIGLAAIQRQSKRCREFIDEEPIAA